MRWGFEATPADFKLNRTQHYALRDRGHLRKLGSSALRQIQHRHVAVHCCRDGLRQPVPESENSTPTLGCQQVSARKNQSTVTSRSRDSSSSTVPAPITTAVSGSSASVTGRPVSSRSKTSRLRSSAPPPASTIPLS